MRPIFQQEVEHDLQEHSYKDPYNYAPVNHVQLPVERWGAYNFSQFEISDNLTASVQFTYSKVQALNQIAQVPMTAVIGT